MGTFRERPGDRRHGVGSLGAGRILVGLAAGFALMAAGLAGLSMIVLGPRGAPSDAGLAARPELLPGLETPGAETFAGGAVPGAGGGVVRSARAVRVVAPGVVVAALERTRAGVPRGGRVRVLPTRRIAARRANVPVAGHPSLQLTTVSRAAPRQAASGTATPDTTSPAITCQTIDPGWHADNVTIDCSADDTNSGLDDPADATFTLSTHVAAGDESSKAATDTYTVCDAAGNCAVANAVALAVDRKAPTVSCDAPDRSWQPANEAIACTAGDAGAGLADPATARSFTLRTTVADGAEAAAAATGSRQVCDDVDNCATAGPVTGLRIDRKAPRLRLSQDPDGAHGWFDTAPAELHAAGQDDQLARVTCVADGDSDARRTASDPDTATLALTADGTHDVTCTATDRAGNATTDTATVALDTTAPSLSLDTDHSTYGVDETIAASCTAGDALSGIGSRDCPARTTPASSLTLGTHRLTATAIDVAGNQATASASFEVTVSVASLTGLTNRLVSDAQAAGTLDADLAAVGAAPDGVAKAAAVTAYENAVRGLPAAAIGADDAAALVRFAGGL